MKIYFKNRSKSIDAVGIVNDGSDWIVCKGSKVSMEESKTISTRIASLRGTPGLIKEGILQKDMHFNSASTAGQFVSGCSVNGMRVWKTKDGESVSSCVASKQRKPFKNTEAQ